MIVARGCGLAALLLTVFVAGADAQEWARFRGPNGSGISPATLPARFSDKDYLWKVELPGLGHSSPILWGERIFVTAASKTGKRLVLCLDAVSGKTHWTHESDGGKYHTHRRNTFATATPCADEKHVYVTWATPGQYIVQALDHEGRSKWQTDLGPYKSQHGMGVSPVVVGDLVIVPGDMDGKGGFLAALERDTGKVRWKTPRQSGNATYATPCLYQPQGRTPQLIFTNWKHGVTAIDPATGKVEWELSVFEPNRPERSIASPVVAGDLLLGTCGFVTAQKHLVAVRPGDLAQGVKPKEAWRIEKAVSYLPTPLVKDGLVFLCSEQGVATCLDRATGKTLWQERLEGKFSASPVCAGERIFCVSDAGDVYVLAPTRKFQLLARNALGETVQATPAIANGRMYFRTARHLIAVGGKKG
jgi:outer membrane protein assembly factor BamB